MNAKELSIQLRDGNWINYVLNPVKCSIETIYAVSKIRGESIMYSGIPLTGEWLERFGFKKGPVYFSFKRFDCDMKGWFGYDQSIAKVPLKYVHQLQNLYFALTGEELEIKL